MGRVAIVTDSASDLTSEVVNNFGITVVPLTIRFGDEQYLDVEEMAPEAFYEKLATFSGLPETAAPSPGQFETAFKAAAADGASAVVCINLSSGLSATMESAMAARRAVGDEIDVRVVDSRSITSGLGAQVVHAARMAADGADADQIESAVASLSERTHVYATLATLEALRKGGRIGGAQAMLGTMLSIKPIISIRGEVAEAGKTRTRKKSFEWLRDKLREMGPVEHLSLRHAAAEDIDDFIAMIRADLPAQEFDTGLIGPVIGTHAGQGCIGITFLTPTGGS